SDACMSTPATNTTPCRSCATNLIMVTTDGNGAKAMDGDVVDRTTGACATRTFSCLGMNANIETSSQINRFGVIADGDDGAIDGSVMFVVMCNAAGTAWQSGGVDITQV
ncbi:hypothetical protein PFISCL1PPCAC_27934, partial [Pristionchus fissidentatus]